MSGRGGVAVLFVIVDFDRGESYHRREGLQYRWAMPENSEREETVVMNMKADPQAIAVALKLREVADADCVVLFGSRSRADWTAASDVDLMALNDALPDQSDMLRIQEQAARIAADVFGKFMPVDVLFMTHDEYRAMSRHTVNHVAARANRDGVTIHRNPDSGGYVHGAEARERCDQTMEHVERERRIADANAHYRDMHGLLDLGFLGKNTAFLAQQTIEHAMKALISALGAEYAHHHRTLVFAYDILRLDPEMQWRFASDLAQLDNFAGGSRYGPALSPILDYREMANKVTTDLLAIYERIKALTGLDPWDVPPDGAAQGIQPRWRGAG